MNFDLKFMIKMFNFVKKNKEIIYLSKKSQGILMIVLASILFSFMAVIIKSLRDFPLMEVVFFRSFPAALVLPLIIKKSKLNFLGVNKFLLLARSSFGFIALVGFVFTFMHMKLTDAMAIRQLAPFFIILLSVIFLKEKIKLQQLTIFVLVFLGALLVIKPGLSSNIFPAMLGLLSAFFSASAHVIIGKLKSTDHPFVIVYYFTFLSSVIAAIVLILQKNFQWLNFKECMIFVLLGLISLGAQVVLSKAYHLSPPSLLSLYLYSRVLFTAIFGFLFFNEIPDMYSIIGCLLILIGGYIYYKLKYQIIYYEK